jgi:ergothioneine biosynthesis protein EgtB
MTVAIGARVTQDGGMNADEADLPGLIDRFDRLRRLTTDLAASLSDADASTQSMPDASPAKWHLAHTTWFFETFVLRDHLPGYVAYDARWPFLFNSYYEAEGSRMPRASRGLITRPSLAEVIAYRHSVDAAVRASAASLPVQARVLIALGCQHEEQHQELLLTDILNLFSHNPIAPALFKPLPISLASERPQQSWVTGQSGLAEVGHEGVGFSFDCEGPRHKVWLEPHALADRPVSNGEWRDFMEDGAYANPALWLSDGWNWVQENGIQAPEYWRRDTHRKWATRFGLDGERQIDWAAPVSHVSYYEADAFARWAGARLPTEAEWETAAATLDPRVGNLLDGPGVCAPAPAEPGGVLWQMFGDVWEWTASAYLPYPGFRAAAGAVGEYNGKFMSGQFVLRGGSCATPRGHARASYRNFFHPHQRWQFSGVRLAKDL